MSVTDQSEKDIVKSLEKNESRQYTEAAHAEMMRRQIVAYNKAGTKMFWLTVVIGILTFVNIAINIVNILR